MKKKDIIYVRCNECEFSSGEVNNYLTDCSHPVANPDNAYMGTYERRCNHYKKRGQLRPQKYEKIH